MSTCQKQETAQGPRRDPAPCSPGKSSASASVRFGIVEKKNVPVGILVVCATKASIHFPACLAAELGHGQIIFRSKAALETKRPLSLNDERSDDRECDQQRKKDNCIGGCHRHALPLTLADTTKRVLKTLPDVKGHVSQQASASVVGICRGKRRFSLTKNQRACRCLATPWSRSRSSRPQDSQKTAFWLRLDSRPRDARTTIGPDTSTAGAVSGIIYNADMNGGMGRPAPFSHRAIAPATSRTAGRCVMRSRHRNSRGVDCVIGAPLRSPNNAAM